MALLSHHYPYAHCYRSLHTNSLIHRYRYPIKYGTKIGICFRSNIDY